MRACDDMIDLLGRGFTLRIASTSPQRLLPPVKRECIAASKPCCWWLRGIPWPRRPAAAASTAPASIGGWPSTGRSMRPRRSSTGRAAGVRACIARSRRSGWRRPWRVTRAVAATKPRAGRCRCWHTTWPRTKTSWSARGRCDADCTRQAIAGSGRAMSMASGQLICRRKRGADPASEGGLAAWR